VGQALVQIQGQHQQHALLHPDFHLSFLDLFAGLSTRADRARSTFSEGQAADASLAAFRERARQFDREHDMLSFQVDEIRKADLRSGEEERLRDERSRLRNSARLGELIREAADLLDGADDGTVAGIVAKSRTLSKRLDEVLRLDPSALLGVRDATATATSALLDLSAAVADYAASLDVEPARIEEVESRLSDIERLKKKYGLNIDEILSFLKTSEVRLDEIQNPEAEERRLKSVAEKAWSEYSAAAAQLSKERRAAAIKLQKAIAKELADLAMTQCRFEVRFTPDSASAIEWRMVGLETAEFYFSANPGEDLRPLKSVASGGELSRALLALQSLLSTPSHASVVFDEVDAGIGGAVAEAVGRRLSRVAGQRQVLCVTHLAQVAAFAQRHFVVEKRVTRGRTHTEVREVSDRDRVREVARMLAGEVVTESAEANARELIQRVAPTAAS